MPQINLSNLTLNKVPKELFLVLGGNRTAIDAGFEPNADSSFAQRIPENKRALVASNNPWQAGKKYVPWTPGITDNYYVLNQSNNIVYLCVSSNTNNRVDGSVITSAVIPNHETPAVQSYSDGYSWLPLFKLDPSQLIFLNDTDLPLYDINVKQEYSTFAEKYEPLCGSGVTSFGCCCLYFKNTTSDELTGEVYNKGDVSNETIFSDCYECQKLADILDRQPIFLNGYTAGSITSSSTGENPLCAATTIISTLAETLEANKYDFVLGSSNEFALSLLSNFTNTAGVMKATIDLTNLTTQQKTVSTPNPIVNVIDPIGTGASVQLKTTQTGVNSYEVYGIETLSPGQNYLVPDHLISGTTAGNILNTVIDLYTFPEGIFESTELLVPAKSYKIKSSLSSTEVKAASGIDTINKYAIMANPGLTGGGRAEFTQNSSVVTSMEYRVFLKLKSAFTQCGLL
jgi:hypothetical protein